MLLLVAVVYLVTMLIVLWVGVVAGGLAERERLREMWRGPRE